MSQSPTIDFTDLETTLSENIKNIFQIQLGHRLNEIHCNFLENKLVIIIKEALTKPELLLIKNGHIAIAKEVRNSIEEILQPQLKKLIEEITELEVTEILFATHLDENCVSLITLFADSHS